MWLCTLYTSQKWYVKFGATGSLKLELNKGYHQCEMDQSLWYIITVSTHLGLKGKTWLCFGISAATKQQQSDDIVVKI